MKTTIITLCSSVSFYEHLVTVARELISLGYEVKLPDSAETMLNTGHFDADRYKPWYEDSSHFPKKAALIKKHFEKIVASDAVLIINDKKNAIEGYIGGNVLMEMSLAFYYRKPIYLLHSVALKNPLYEEIMGMLPIIIENDLKKIKI